MDAARVNLLASENRAARALIVAGCGYECVAMLSRQKLPTISMCCWKLGFIGKVLAGVVLTVLGLHLYATPPEPGIALHSRR